MGDEIEAVWCLAGAKVIAHATWSGRKSKPDIEELRSWKSFIPSMKVMADDGWAAVPVLQPAEWGEYGP